jgi:hypothetical protein
MSWNMSSTGWQKNLKLQAMLFQMNPCGMGGGL